MDKLQLAREVFAGDRYATEATGIVLESIGEHTAVCSLALRTFHRNARGAVMGGVLGTLADFCFAVASNSECLDNLQWVSTESTLHFLAQPRDNKIMAEAHALRIGHNTCLFQVDVIEADGSNRLLAHAVVAGVKVERR